MQQLNPSADCVSNLELDEWLAGELSVHDEQRLLQHVAHCERCQTRRALIERESAAFFSAAPSFREHAERFAQAPAAAGLPAQVARGTRRTPHRTMGLAAAAVAMAALVGLMLLPAQPNATRPKGDPHLGFFVKREGAVNRGSNGATVYPNDFIRFVYTSDRSYHFAVFNVDARAASVYFPQSAQSEQVFAGNDVPLDFSVQLDEQLGTERIVALFCPNAFAIEPLRAALAERFARAVTDELPNVPAGCRRDVITLNKVAHP